MMDTEEKVVKGIVGIFVAMILMVFSSSVSRQMLMIEYEREILFERNIVINGTEVSCSIIEGGGK